MALSLCGQSVDNTGQLACDKSKGIGKKIFIFNGAIAAADYASNDLLLSKLIANEKLSKTATNKIFPIPEIQEIADASEANTEGTLGLGFKLTIREGKPVYNCKVFAGADLLKRLRTFNKQTVRILEYDSNGLIWGTKSGTNFVGYQAILFFDGGKLATGQNVEEGIVSFSLSILSNSEYKDNSYWAEIDGNIEDVAALNDVTMGEVSNASNVYKVDLKIKGTSLVSDYNIWDDYGSAIAALTFTAQNVETGAAFTVTSVAADNTLKCLTVTLDSTAYTALTSGDQVKLIPPTPATLDAANVANVELLPLIITKP
jgi:hypothetical protein